MLIRPETLADHDAIRQVNWLAFGQETEGALVDGLRAGGYARLSLVAEDNGQVIGHILFSDLPICTLSKVVMKAVALAPMAVIPSRQRQGIGTALVREGLRFCKEQGLRIVVVVGHLEYYPRFGFSPKLAEPLTCPYSGPALMALEFVPGALHGVAGKLKYPPPPGFYRVYRQNKWRSSSQLGRHTPTVLP
jgi:putative acetyltransferase